MLHYMVFMVLAAMVFSIKEFGGPRFVDCAFFLWFAIFLVGVCVFVLCSRGQVYSVALCI